MKKCYISKLTVALTITLITANASPGYAAWIRSNDGWAYQQDQTQEYVKNAWADINSARYYFDADGKMATGWLFLNGFWYFLNPAIGQEQGKMLTGWQWIDGYCYFFTTAADNSHPAGSMYIDGLTPDGYMVNASGAWSSDQGIAHYVTGKGIRTKDIQVVSGSRHNSSGSSGGGGGNGGNSGEHIEQLPNPIIPQPEPDIPTQPEQPEQDVSKPATPSEARKTYDYVIRYLDIKDKTILHILNGQAAAGDSIDVEWLEFDGYEIHADQKETFKLASNNMVFNIYYDHIDEATPSEVVKKTKWNIYFVEKDNPENYIFKTQSGESAEGTELVVDFPETITGRDGYYYDSLLPSPYTILIGGDGRQKHYIEYRRGDPIKPEEDPDQLAHEKLEKWIELTRAADQEITGIEPSSQQIITNDQEESNERLKNLISAVDDTKRHEVYLIARGHKPNALTIGTNFPEVVNISELVADIFSIDGETYTVMRVGFQKTFHPENCTHRFMVSDTVPAECLANGHETVVCTKCGLEESVIIPAGGHRDLDGDGICDICCDVTDGAELPDPVHYDIGDLQAREIGSEIYLFRCIDDDYKDALGNSQKTALFLCDSVIRSDVISSGSQHTKKMTFGTNNNYKYSNPRKWLNDSAVDKLFEGQTSYVGIAMAYSGSSRKGTYDQLDEDAFTAMEKPFQLMEDKIFLLSLEEALEYRDYLWKFGSDENNPESQISTYSRGYYLRTPQFAGTGSFQYGSGIYVVDLENGNIRVSDISDTSIGMRPAITVRQG